MATADNLGRVLADIDSLLPPGAPSTPDSSGERWEDDAMRWQPVDHDNHPDKPQQPPRRPYVHDRAVLDRLLDLYPNAHGWVAADDVGRIDLANFDRHFPTWPATWWIGPALRATEYAAALDNLTREAQRTATNLQHLRARWDRHGQAFAVIEARRNRNTGPSNPRGIDGRARRRQHPRRAAAPSASPATQGSATPVILTWRDGALALGFDPAWQ